MLLITNHQEPFAFCVIQDSIVQIMEVVLHAILHVIVVMEVQQIVKIVP